MNFTGGLAGRDDVDVLAIEHSDGWLYEVWIKNHPTHKATPYRGATKYATKNKALEAGEIEAGKLLQST